MIITFTQSQTEIDAHDFIEVTLNLAGDLPANPFVDVEVRGTFALVGEAALAVDGFCDSADGSVHRIRFMPMGAGDYVYTVTYRQGQTFATHHGTFTARDAGHEDSADDRRKLAWEMTMASGYKSNSEYAHIREFFTAFEWQRLKPRPELASGALCLAEPGVRYMVYLPQGGRTTLKPDGRAYHARWFNPRTCDYTNAISNGNVWTAPDDNDWALIVEMQY